MKVSTPQIFYIDTIIQIINEYIKQDNNLLNCNWAVEYIIIT
jgi:hypothetical protein